jgi:hypothetical protein
MPLRGCALLNHEAKKKGHESASGSKFLLNGVVAGRITNQKVIELAGTLLLPSPDSRAHN